MIPPRAEDPSKSSELTSYKIYKGTISFLKEVFKMFACKSAVIVLLCVVLALVQGQKSSSRFDNVDVDAVLSNKRLLKNYVDCLLGTRVCTPEGAEVKRLLPQSIKSECADCTPKQKENSKKVLNYFLNTDADYWERLEKLYDPTGEYKKRSCERARRDGLATAKRCK